MQRRVTKRQEEGEITAAKDVRMERTKGGGGRVEGEDTSLDGNPGRE